MIYIKYSTFGKGSLLRVLGVVWEIRTDEGLTEAAKRKFRDGSQFERCSMGQFKTRRRNMSKTLGSKRFRRI